MNVTEKKRKLEVHACEVSKCEGVMGSQDCLIVCFKPTDLTKQSCQHLNFPFRGGGHDPQTPPKASCFNATAVWSGCGTIRPPAIMLGFLPELGGCYCPSGCC